MAKKKAKNLANDVKDASRKIWLAGLGALAVAGGVASIVRNSRLDFTIPVLVDLRLDGTVVAFTLLMSVATGLVFGLLPALRATRRDVNATLRDDAASGLGRLLDHPALLPGNTRGADHHASVQLPARLHVGHSGLGPRKVD